MTAAALIKLQAERSETRFRKGLEGLDERELKARPQNLAPALWQLGHIVASDWALLNRAGVPPEIPAFFQEEYRKDTKGENLAQSAAQIWEGFAKVQAGFLALSGSDLDKPLVHPAGIYGNVGEGLMYMLIHRGYHHGKLMTLRALLGKS